MLLLQIDAPCTIVSGGHMDRTKEVICNLASPLNFVIEMFSYSQVFNPIAIALGLPQCCVVIFQPWEKLERLLIKHRISAESEVVQVDPFVAG